MGWVMEDHGPVLCYVIFVFEIRFQNGMSTCWAFKKKLPRERENVQLVEINDNKTSLPVVGPFKLSSLLMDRGTRNGFEKLDQNDSDEENEPTSMLSKQNCNSVLYEPEDFLSHINVKQTTILKRENGDPKVFVNGYNREQNLSCRVLNTKDALSNNISTIAASRYSHQASALAAICSASALAHALASPRIFI
uniref:Uncharacterized protein n=1 Tax=Glossina brevipalpis TaxID=37001 RepID=A0A1A9W3M4_9MUSC